MSDPFKITEPTVISFSGGRTSGYMLWRVLQSNDGLPEIAKVCFANTGKEDEATLKFVKECEENWGVPITWLEYKNGDPRYKVVDFDTASRNGEPFEMLIEYKKYLPTPVTRFCTAELKIRTVKRYMLSMGFKIWTACLGIRYDEPRRWAKNGSANERWDNWNPLVDWKITKPDVLKEIATWPFDLELKVYEGNCDLCFLKGIAKKRMIIRDEPEAADWWIEMEEQKGQTFHKSYTYRGIRDKIKTAPEFKFDLDVNQDFECFCNID